MLGYALPVTRDLVEAAAAELMGACCTSVIIRCGAMGAYGMRSGEGGNWVDAYWKEGESQYCDYEGLVNPRNPSKHVVDVTGKSFLDFHVASAQYIATTGAGNAFLGGLSAGLHFFPGDIERGQYQTTRRRILGSLELQPCTMETCRRHLLLSNLAYHPSPKVSLKRVLRHGTGTVQSEG